MSTILGFLNLLLSFFLLLAKCPDSLDVAEPFLSHLSTQIHTKYKPALIQCYLSINIVSHKYIGHILAADQLAFKALFFSHKYRTLWVRQCENQALYSRCWPLSFFQITLICYHPVWLYLKGSVQAGPKWLFRTVYNSLNLLTLSLPRSKSYILPTFQRGMYKSFIWVSYEKPSSSHCIKMLWSWTVEIWNLSLLGAKEVNLITSKICLSHTSRQKYN